MTCDVSANLTAYTGYTIGTSGTITVDTYNIFYLDAVDEFTQIDPGCGTRATCRVKAYLIADYIAAKIGDHDAFKSEKIGSYSYTISDEISKSNRSKWYARAIKIISDCYKGVPIKLSTLTDGIERNDSEYYDSIMKLDQNPIVDLNNEYR